MFLGKKLDKSKILKVFILNSGPFLFYQLTVMNQKPIMIIKTSFLLFKSGQ